MTADGHVEGPVARRLWRLLTLLALVAPLVAAALLSGDPSDGLVWAGGAVALLASMRLLLRGRPSSSDKT
jgi:uncharacterized membrane protein YfcA